MLAQSASLPADVDRALWTLGRRLRAAARPAAISDDAVRAYCAAIGLDDHPLEGALLRRAADVIDVDLLIDRLVADARARFAEVPGRATAMWLNPRCQPPLLRRLPRVRRLYWARLRDYLIWIASRGAD